MRIANLVTKVRTLSPGRSSVTYWASLAVLMLLAGLPFALLSWAAPSSEVEESLAPSAMTAPARVTDPAPNPSAAVSLPSSGPTGATPDASEIAATPSPAPADVPPPSEAKGADFDIRCWPTVSVVPGGSATVECSIPVFHGDGRDISLECRAEGMACEMSPRKVRAFDNNQTLTAKLTVTAPGSLPVGNFKAQARASGGETGAAFEETDVDVNVPPPFSVICESIGASFAKGSDARIKCWVTFAAGFSDDVALSISNGDAAHAALDTPALRPVPNQTRSFTIQLDTEQLETRSYVVGIRAESVRYTQEASALFQVLPR